MAVVEYLKQTDGSRQKTRKVPDASWVACVDGEYPRSVVFGCNEPDARFMVARAEIENEGVIPGKFFPRYKKAFFPLHAKEVSRTSYELLVARLKSLIWLDSSNGKIEPNAVIGGEENGETLFVGRAYHDHHMHPGKIVPSLKRCYITFEKRQLGFREYEILVRLLPDEERPEGSRPIKVTPRSSKSLENFRQRNQGY